MTRAVFADSYFYFALLNQRERAHAPAVAFVESFTGQLVTTGWVLTEVADGLSRPGDRQRFVSMYEELVRSPSVRIVPCSDALHQEGIRLYAARPDKDWPLTDCISFVVMRDGTLGEALTADHHFEQAGFVALLK